MTTTTAPDHAALPHSEATFAPPGALHERFLALSVILTGCERLTLQGTGQVDTYFQEVNGIVGERLCERLWTRFHEVYEQHKHDPAGLEEAIRHDILEDPFCGPLARNIITLWYMSTWNQLPQAWRNAYGASARDSDHLVSAAAYTEGLIWRVMGTHPPGAKQPGYGSWSLPPTTDPL